MTLRDSVGHDDWPLRSWIMGAVGLVAGWLFVLLTSVESVPPWRQAAASLVLVSALSFIVTVELRRLRWSLLFAALCGAISAFVGWFTASYNFESDIFQWSFLSGLFAVLLAAPLFQTIRDEGAWRFPYARLHRHSWTDAVIGAASLAFTGAVFLLAWLIAELFHLIGVEVLQHLLENGLFNWMLGGFAFGAAFGLLREREELLATLQRLVMVVLSVLAPVLAIALLQFLASLPFTGLGRLWSSGLPTTPIMLLSGAGAILLTNAVIGNGKEDRSRNRLLRWSALGLVVTVLPLAVVAAISMSVRVQHYGWTPERMWGVVAVGIAIAYGLSGWWSVYRGGRDYDETLRPLQTAMAIGLCAIALFLALPIVDFGAISAKSQIERLKSHRIPPDDFDWKAMAFDFGPAGRRQLKGIVETGDPEQKLIAKAALNATSRYDVDIDQAGTAEQLDQNLRRIPQDFVLTPELRRAIVDTQTCRRDSKCLLLRLADDRLIIVEQSKEGSFNTETLLRQGRKWNREYMIVNVGDGDAHFRSDLTSAKVEVRTVQRRQLFIDGHSVGGVME
jgi:hypothetical protein